MMRSLKLPAVVLPQTDYARLEQLVVKARADRHPFAPFLFSEIERARVTHDRAVLSEVATLNRWITYRLDWGPTENRCLVHPDDYACQDRQLSVLSPEGAAVVGIGIGDRMPFTDGEGNRHLITLISVDAGPRVVSFNRRVVSHRQTASDDPFDPGPSAA
jgi:regulator of nucleoside diphosphate kinase